MEIKFTEEKGRLTVALTGELDHHEARTVSEKLLREIDVTLPRDCVLDMKGVGFMDSSGIAVALKAYKKMMRLGGRLWIENVRRQPMHVFDAAGIDRVIGITSAV